MALGQNNESANLWQENKTLTARVKELEEALEEISLKPYLAKEIAEQALQSKEEK